MNKLLYSHHGKNSALLIATSLLLLMFGLAVHSMMSKSPTYDEQSYIIRGLGYLRGENTYMRVGHPLGLNALNTIFLVKDETVKLPTEDPSWQETSFHRPSELFLWEIGNDVAHIMFLARLPTVFLGLLLAALVGRWAWEIGGKRPFVGLFALALIALDPNILAHTRLATTDLGLAAGALLAGYLLWRYFQKPSWQRAILAGIGFGLLQDTKSSAVLFVPLFALVIAVGFLVLWRKDGQGWRPFFIKIILPLVVAFPVVAFLTLWAAYGFDVSTLPASPPTFSQLGGYTLPLAHHIEQLLYIGDRLQKSTPAFLLGNYSDSGWWYYFPITFLVKTPLPVLILLIAAITVLVRRLVRKQYKSLPVINLAALLIPPVGFFAIALTSDINLGYRYLLPVLPFLVVFTSAVLVPAVERVRPAQAGLIFSVVWLFVATLWISPDFLAFFNILAGGPENGWRVLVDSNLDWGQDLQNLKRWMDDHGVDEVWLSYFGEARPEYYGIAYRGLDSHPPRLMNPQARPFYPANPAPGIYAISATTLQGVHFSNHDLFAWFKAQKPVDKIGYSIFLYEVPSQSDPINVALGNIQLDEIDPADFDQLGTNNIVPRWFDASLAFPLMEGSMTAVLTPPGTILPDPLAAVFQEIYEPVYTGQTVAIFRPSEAERPISDLLLNESSIDWQIGKTAVFVQNAGQIGFNGYSLADPTLVPGGSLTILTISKQLADPTPVKMFIHLTDLDGNIAAQWDGLGTVWQSWLTGDVLVQQHVLPLPDDLAPGDFQLWVGYYHPDTLVRWLSQDQDGQTVDRIPLVVLTFQ
ncbi:MAG: phospholipid carrier-dependent glycosyltransferase [Candidatus Promineifilaceae bacterium]